MSATAAVAPQPLSATKSAVVRKRDYRLDFFRGIALIYIFLDHIPSNAVSWVTIRNYGFSDATEIFIFISGYSASLAYGRVMRDRGFLIGTAQVWRRVWQLYIAHVFLFVIYTAQIAYLAARFDNPMFAEEMGITQFLEDPHVTVVQALLLKFKPANLDILPLYIALLLVFPPVLWALQRRPLPVLAGSAALYVAVQVTGWNLAAYPNGEWLFDPFAYQLLFVIGALAPAGWPRVAPLLPRPRFLLPLALIFLLLALVLALSWQIPWLDARIPGWVGALVYPIDKVKLDPLRLVHFLALAYVSVLFIGADHPLVHARVVRPLLRCGQQSLQIFCLGVFLSFIGHFYLVEIDDTLKGQILVSVVGIAIMVGVAYLLTWYKTEASRR